MGLDCSSSTSHALKTQSVYICWRSTDQPDQQDPHMDPILNDEDPMTTRSVSYFLGIEDQPMSYKIYISYQYGVANHWRRSWLIRL